jgi:hypothetical protein
LEKVRETLLGNPVCPELVGYLVIGNITRESVVRDRIRKPNRDPIRTSNRKSVREHIRVPRERNN